MSSKEQRANGNHTAPATATTAVLKPSEPVPTAMRRVDGIEFDKYAEKELTVSELLGGMADIGFQASAVTEAVRIINNMVSCSSHDLKP